MALAPALYLLTTGGGGGSQGYELSAVAPVTTAGPGPTWLAPDRIVEEPLSTATTMPTTTTVAWADELEAEEDVEEDVEVAAPVRAPTTEAVEATDYAPEAPDPEPTASTESATAPPETATTTTTTVAPAAAATASLTPAHAPTHREQGQATWFNAPDNSCAHRTAPIGTIITVTRISTNTSTTCYVDQWGPEATYRVIDLSMDTFEKLAPPEAGVIDVVIEW